MSETTPRVPVAAASPVGRLLSAADFHRLADVPPEVEWFANLGNKNTRRVYEHALQAFMRFAGIGRPEELRTITRAHIIAWREDLVRQQLSAMTVRHHLSALSSLFEYLCEKNAIMHNPVNGVKRPPVESSEGKTPALGDNQARQLLDAPDGTSLQAKRDRAILATLLYHGLRRVELCQLKVKDCFGERRGVAHIKISGKGGKTRYVPLHPAAGTLIADYVKATSRVRNDAGALFQALRPNRTNETSRSITPDAVYKIVRGYSAALGFEIGAHALRATAATNALDHQADITKVQEWLGHANIATTRIYDRRKTRSEESPTFKVTY